MTTSKHPHTIIRHAAVAVLTGQTSAGAAVRASRKNPWKSSEIPSGGIVIYTQKSKTDPSSTRSQQTKYLRSIDLFILIAMGAPEDATTAADDAVDAIARQVEVLMLNNATLGLETNDDAQAIGLQPYECRPAEMETDLEESGRIPVSFALLQYTVTVYDQMLDANSGEIDDFATAGVTTNLGGAQAPAEQTEDVDTIPT